jgi:hypothetical protein
MMSFNHQNAATDQSVKAANARRSGWDIAMGIASHRSVLVGT